MVAVTVPTDLWEEDTEAVITTWLVGDGGTYKLILAGTFENTLKFMQATQRLPFITHAKDISVVSTKDDQTRTQISSEFYIKK